MMAFLSLVPQIGTMCLHTFVKSVLKKISIYVFFGGCRPEIVDPAILRPGRLGKLIGIPLPDADGRASILKALSRKKPIDSDVDFHVISRMRECENFTGAHLAALVCVFLTTGQYYQLHYFFQFLFSVPLWCRQMKLQ